jgi:hypothetical protein
MEEFIREWCDMATRLCDAYKAVGKANSHEELSKIKEDLDKDNSAGDELGRRYPQKAYQVMLSVLRDLNLHACNEMRRRFTEIESG